MSDSNDRDPAEITQEFAVPLLPSPASVSGAGARLVVLKGPDAGRKFVLAGHAVIGRAPGVPVRLQDALVSRRHAAITRERQSVFLLEDLGSRNGVFLNGRRVVRSAISFGDRIVVGSTIVLFAHRDAEEDRILERERLEMLGRLAAGVAHDMNNLLTVVGACSFCLRDLVPSLAAPVDALDEATSCLDAILTATERGRDLTAHLLRFARRERIESAEFDLSATVCEAIELAERTFHRSVELVRDIEESIRLVGDRGELHRAVMNLLLNARDAMPDGGRLEVALRALSDAGAVPAESRPTPPLVRLVVRDSGIGMDAVTRSRIFEPFFTTKGPGRGSGIGLSSVAQAIAAHGGWIDCTSVPERGTSFEIVLPRSAPSSPPTAYPPAPEGAR